MMDFPTWRDLAAAFVTLRARAAGFMVKKYRLSSTGTMYVELVAGTRSAVVRLADHRPFRSERRRESMLSIRQARTLRLDEVDRFFARRLSS